MKHLYLMALALLLVACNESPGIQQASETNTPSDGLVAELTTAKTYQEANAAAVAAIAIATEKGHAWTTSDALLKQAKAAAENGDEDRAIQLAEKARLLGELASEQADTETIAWKERVLPDN